MSIITKERGGSEVEIYASGVGDLSLGTLNCNQEDLIGTMNQMANEMNPARDWYGKFAANITITIGLTGELEGNDGKK